MQTQKEIKKGELLQPTLLDMSVGEAIRIPFKLFSENTLRSMASQIKFKFGMSFDVNTRSNTTAVVTRIL